MSLVPEAAQFIDWLITNHVPSPLLRNTHILIQGKRGVADMLY